MTSRMSFYTGNTVFTSDDGRFSSLSERQVRSWESEPRAKELEWDDAYHWANAGHLPEIGKCFERQLKTDG